MRTTHLPSVRAAVRPVLALALLAAGACDRVDRLLAIETPSRIAEDALLQPANASLLVTSATGDFHCALNSYIVVSGLAAGELADVSQTAARWSYDRRDVRPSDALYATTGCEGLGIYTPLSTARYTNDQALRRLEEWTDAEVPNRMRLIAQSAAFAGYSMLLLGEGFCSAPIEGGPELTSEQLFDSAEVRFTRAIEAATAAGATDLLNLARVGRARARLNGGDAAGAIADATPVPAGFVYNLTGGTLGRYVNRVFAQNNSGTSVQIPVAYRGLTVQGQPDPRVVVSASTAGANDGSGPLFRQGKYSALDANVRVASGVEAQLILAEATGGAAGGNILNTLRARASVGLPALTAGEAAAFTATVFEERRRELWLQGNRWYDLRRGNLPLTPATGATYPKGGVYGDQRCWPLPDVERFANDNIPDSP